MVDSKEDNEVRGLLAQRQAGRERAETEERERVQCPVLSRIPNELITEDEND